MSKQTKIVLSVFLSFFIAIFFGFIMIGFFTSEYMINARNNGYQTDGIVTQKILVQKEWMQENSTRVQMTNRSGLSLNAYKIMQATPTNKWLIAMHGYRGEAFQVSDYGLNFYEAGFNVLLPDQRGEGYSEGDWIGMGHFEQYDLIDWIDYIVELNPNAQIALFGVSMGAATVMLATGHDLPSNVKVAIEDCGYTSIDAQLTNIFINYVHINPYPANIFADLFFRIRAGYSLYDGDATKAVSNSHTPTFFVHGSEDTFVPYPMVDVLYENCSAPKEKLIIEGAQHACSSSYNPDLYWEKVLAFVNKYIP